MFTDKELTEKCQENAYEEVQVRCEWCRRQLKQPLEYIKGEIEDTLILCRDCDQALQDFGDRSRIIGESP